MSWFTQRDKHKPESEKSRPDMTAEGRGGAARGRRMLRDMAVFSMFAAMMFVSTKGVEIIPNIHPLAMFIVLLTVVYRRRALIPIYIFVMLYGISWGFSISWIPYLYVWTILWGAAMLLPRKMPDGLSAFVYPLLCSLHGLSFGTLYAPSQALFYGFTFNQTIAWIAAGLPYDLLHAAGNLASGLLVLPLSKLLKKLDAK